MNTDALEIGCLLDLGARILLPAEVMTDIGQNKETWRIKNEAQLQTWKMGSNVTTVSLNKPGKMISIETPQRV